VLRDDVDSALKRRTDQAEGNEDCAERFRARDIYHRLGITSQAGALKRTHRSAVRTDQPIAKDGVVMAALKTRDSAMASKRSQGIKCETNLDLMPSAYFKTIETHRSYLSFGSVKVIF
jgi:hypothetical protein